MNKQLSMFVIAVLLLVAITAIVLGLMVDPSNPISWGLIVVLLLSPYIHKKIMAGRYVQWKDEYSVGIEVIDNDHKRLLNLINQLETAAHYQTDATFEKEALDALVDYTKTHFTREEGLMEQYDYPQFEVHKKEHETMIAAVNEYLAAYERDRQGTIESMINFLRDWLIKHINGSDQGYSQHLLDRGVK